MAERARRETQGLSRTTIPEEEAGTHLGRTIFLLLLVLAFGIGVGMYALIGTSPAPSSSDVPNSLEKERGAENGPSIAIDHSSREEILAAIATLFNKTTLARGEIQLITFTANNGARSAILATTSAVFTALTVPPPPQELLYSLNTELSYGVFSDGDITGFFKLRTRSYPDTFAGMLNWEKVMANSLILALNPNTKTSDIALLRGRAFRDERIAGINARVLSDPDGVAMIAYAFHDKKTLIIAGGREALRALIEQSRTAAK